MFEVKNLLLEILQSTKHCVSQNLQGSVTSCADASVKILEDAAKMVGYLLSSSGLSRDLK